MNTTTVFGPEAYLEIRHGLFDPALSYTGVDWGRDVLDPWAKAHQGILAALHDAGRPETAGQALQATDRWALYALSRLADVLILPSQPLSTDPESPQDWMPESAYGQFIAALGRTVPGGSGFHPFLHEIVAVEPSEDPRTPPEVVTTWWPPMMVGSLLMVRAGVTVRAGTNYLDPVVAMTSAMYWASRRRYRPARDLSQGWGSQSLWRTDFRRDYWLADRLAYNVDARLEPAVEHPGGVPFNRDVDLLRHRCATLVDEVEEQWPWENHHEEPVPAGLAAIGAATGVMPG